MTRRFLVHLEYDDEYRGYVAGVPSLPGCTSQGKTEQEALANIEDAIALYLQSLKESGQPLPEGDSDVHVIEVTVPEGAERVAAVRGTAKLKYAASVDEYIEDVRGR